MRIVFKQFCMGGVSLLLFIAVFSTDAWALFQLTATPREGGQSLRFDVQDTGLVSQNRELTLGVATDRGVPYRILQTVYQPLTNENGKTLPAGSLVVFSPSHPLGTLRTQMESTVGMGQSQIYTSDSAGTTDEFVLVYSIRLPEDLPGGVYRTQITFTAEPVNSQQGVSPSAATLDVRVEVTPKFRLQAQSTRGPRALDLGSIRHDRLTASEALRVAVESNAAGRYRLLLQMTQPMVSEKGELLDASTLTVAAQGGSRGALELSQTPVALSSALVPFYRSGEHGQSDEMELLFVVSPSASQKAGIYSGMMSLRAESDSVFVPQEPMVIPVRLQIDSIFSLETQVESGGNLSFGRFQPGVDTSTRRVFLKMLSNLGEPYQVSQVVPRKMTNADGTILANDLFKVKVNPAKTGLVSVPSHQTVKEGETLLFTSDNKGNPETLVLEYVLTTARDTRAGDYSADISYSVTTL